MDRSKRAKERQEKVTVYFDKRAFAEKNKETEEELEILKKKEEGAAAVIAIVLFFGKPLLIMIPMFRIIVIMENLEHGIQDGVIEMME